MPRGTTAATKRSGVANQHSTKHENGLVISTGKKVQKKRSSGHVSGIKPSQAANNRDSNSQSATPPLSTPSTPPPKNGDLPIQADFISEPKMAIDRRTSVGAYSESSASDSYHPLPAIDISSLENHRQIDVNAAKNPNVHRDLGPLTLVYTVLRSCPLSDTLAILIVLLQLPPTVLSIIHLLFATLTFVPPSSTAAYSTFNFPDIFEGSLGTPSVATILVVDIMVLLIWLFLWSPLQDIALDLAQTVIAMTLGGGVSGKERGTGNVMACFGVITVGHLARSGRIKPSGLRMLLSTSSYGYSGPDSELALTESVTRPSDKRAPGLFGSILAIHILTQGVVRYIRDWYVRRERRDTAVAGLGDPEAGNGSLSDSVHDSTPSSNGHPPEIANASLPISNSPDKTLTTKKKKKQSAQVRTWQPLWAALASTKVVMVKEYEASHTAAESAGTNATDINNLGNAPFNTEADRIWIAYVGHDEVSFNTSYFPNHPTTELSSEREECGTPGIDQLKPFFVRVNNTIWQPTRINKAQEEGSSHKTRWSGEIFGLAPMSSYKCEFVSTTTGEVIFASSVRTLRTPMSEAAAVASLSPGPQRSLRPDSPTTTLKTSIATSEVKLSEERNRQKRERKEQKTKLNNSRKEMERLTNNITSSGGNDDRMRQKAQQSNVHKKQAEDLAADAMLELQNLLALPEDNINEWKSAKQIWQSGKDMHKRTRNEIHNAKLSAEREAHIITTDLTTLQQKRERMQGRISKLNGEHERITDANAKGLDEVQRKASKRAAIELDRTQVEISYQHQIGAAIPHIQDMNDNFSVLCHNFTALQQYLATQASQQSPSSSMQNLNSNGYDSTYDTSYPWNPSMNPNFAPPPPYVEMNTSAPSPAMGLQKAKYRRKGRSSSMLSNQSGFTQGSDEGFPLPKDTQELVDESSGTGSSGSVGEKSPMIGKSRFNTSVWEKSDHGF